MRLVANIHTSRGQVEFTIRRVIYENMDAFEVDFWQGNTFLNSEFTVFRACVFMRWNGDRYKIIRRRKDDHTNELWLELEHLVSNIIAVNE